MTVTVNEKTAFIILLYCFPSILRNEELRNKWIRALKRQNKDKTQWKPSESDRVCSIHFLGNAYEANSVQTVTLEYEVEKKKESSPTYIYYCY